MALQLLFNPVSGQFDYIDISTANIYFLAPVDTFSSLPPGDPNGAARVVQDEDALYTYDDGTSTWIFAGKIKTANVGSSPNAQGYSVSANNTLTLQPASTTQPGVITAAAQSLAGVKTFTNAVYANGSVDVTSTGGTDTLNIGTANADIINIGRSGITVNIQGSTIYQNVTNLEVTDKTITINKDGSAGSGTAAGIEVEEGGSITGYVKTSGDRNSYQIKAPNTAGIATITPGSSGITLDQSSHNPVTLGAVGSSPNANAASLSTQVLTLQPADATNPGVVTATTQSFGGNKTFTGNVNVDGTARLATSLTGPLKASSGTVSASAINLTSEVTGVLPIANGGTNSSTSLNNNRIMVSSSGSIVEASALTNGQLLIGSTGAAPVAAAITQGSGITITNGAGSITVAMTKPTSATDISETSFSLSNNQSSAANVTGLSFANASVRSSQVHYSIFIDATTPLYEAGELTLIQKTSSWEFSQTTVGDNSLVAFSVTSAGQVQYTSANYSGFVSGKLQFRAITTAV